MIDTFLFIRLLTPILSLEFLKRCVFGQEFDVWCFQQSSNLASVVHFGDTLSPGNQGVFQLLKASQINESWQQTRFE